MTFLLSFNEEKAKQVTITLFTEGHAYLQCDSSNSESLLKSFATVFDFYNMLAFSLLEDSTCRLVDVLGTGPNFEKQGFGVYGGAECISGSQENV